MKKLILLALLFVGCSTMTAAPNGNYGQCYSWNTHATEAEKAAGPIGCAARHPAWWSVFLIFFPTPSGFVYADHAAAEAAFQKQLQSTGQVTPKPSLLDGSQADFDSYMERRRLLNP